MPISSYSHFSSGHNFSVVSIATLIIFLIISTVLYFPQTKTEISVNMFLKNAFLFKAKPPNCSNYSNSFLVESSMLLNVSNTPFVESRPLDSFSNSESSKFLSPPRTVSLRFMTLFLVISLRNYLFCHQIYLCFIPFFEGRFVHFEVCNAFNDFSSLL